MAKFSKRLKITQSEQLLLLNSLSKMLGSGASLSESLTAIQEESKRKQFRKVINIIKSEIDEGSPLWRSFEKQKIVDMHGISLLRIGEQSGRMVENLSLLTKQQQKAKVFNQKIKSALSYPVFVLGLTTVVGTLIAWFVLPKLTQVFSSLQTELPLATRILINSGDFLKEYGIFAVPGFVVVVITVIYFLFIFDKTKHVGQSMLLAVPGLKTLIRKVELARFGYLLGTLLDSGIPITEAFASLAESSRLKRYKNFYTESQNKILEGKSFRVLFKENKDVQKFIPRTDQQIIVAAERSGRLSATLIEVGAQAEQETEQVLKNITVLLEPIMLVIVWIGVVGVALAVILPIYQLVGSIN